MEQRAALADFSMDRVVPFFQPIMELNNNKVWRYECLARLLTDSEKIFLPNDFLYIVERAQSSQALTHHIYELSRRYCQHRNMPWNINLSDQDLKGNDLLEWFDNLTPSQRNGLFGIEVSYDLIKHNTAFIESVQQHCGEIVITVDDVYEHSHSLDEILMYGVDALKLKGDFVKAYAASGVGEECMIGIQQSCLLHDTKLIAEHIEDKATCDAVKAIGIQYGQGFYFSEPSAQIN